MEIKVKIHWLTKIVLGLMLVGLNVCIIYTIYSILHTKIIQNMMVNPFWGGIKEPLISRGNSLIIGVIIIGYLLVYGFYKWRIRKNTQILQAKNPSEIYAGESFGKFLLHVYVVFIAGVSVILFFGYDRITLNIDESAFVRADFDYDNPTYTDKKICSDFESYTKTLPNPSGVVKFSTQSQTITGSIYTSILEPQNPKFQAIDMENDIEELGKYLESHKDTPEFENVFSAIKKDIISDADYTELKEKISALPDNMKCFTRNDTNIKEELFPYNLYQLTIIKILGRKANMLVWEGKIDEAIIVVNTLHTYNQKLRGSNLTLGDEMLEIYRYNIEYATIENIGNKSNDEQKNKLRELIKDKIDFEENFKDAIRGDYYFFNHALTGRGKSLKNIHIPFLFDGEDTLNRAIILVYGRMLFEKDYADRLLKENRGKFNTPFEAGFVANLIESDEGITTSPLGDMYNALGKKYIESWMPALNSYKKRIELVSAYQQYLRYLMR